LEEGNWFSAILEALSGSGKGTIMVDVRPILGDSVYRDLNVDLTLDYMRRRYVDPLRSFVNIEQATLADCGCGFGWLSFAYLWAGGRRAILVDQDAKRVEAAARIAELLGYADRCEFHCRHMQNLDIGPVDVFASIETLEHVGRENIPNCVQAMASSSLKAIILTTPNRWFPLVAHDTGLPLAHWMPLWLRTRYARAAGRGDREMTNAFLSPRDLRPMKERGFQPISRYQTFPTYSEFESFYPHYLPYGEDEQSRYRSKPKTGLAAYVRIAGTLAGRSSFAFAPNLASIWVRGSGNPTGD
jgi:hypothetical protein